MNQGAPDPPLTALVWLRSLNKVETGHRPEENHPIEQVRPLRFLQNRKEETDLTSTPTRARTSGGMSRSRTLAGINQQGMDDHVTFGEGLGYRHKGHSPLNPPHARKFGISPRYCLQMCLIKGEAWLAPRPDPSISGPR